MQIALDGSDLAAERFEGPSVYAGELLPRLSHLLREQGHEVITYAPGPLRGVRVDGEVRVIPGAPYWTQRILARALLRDRPDVLFLPIQMLPVFRPRRMATVAVVHDLEFLRYPETYTVTNQLLLRMFTRAAVRSATRLIAVSQYAKDDIVRVYGRAAEDITVVHHGVDRVLFSNRVDPEDDAVRRRYAIPERMILFVGSLQPRKNLRGLLESFERLSGMGCVADRLVIVSGGAWKEAPIQQRISRSPRRADIQVIRRVARADLPAFYRAARVFVLPSFSEGFGMPVLEAMASGVPVVTSNTSALPEVAGDAAVLVDPRDPAAIAEAIGRVLRDEALRGSLVEKVIERARHFTWDQAAAQTAGVLEQAGKRR